MSHKERSLRTIPKWIWLISAVFLSAQYFICRNVFVMGDDYMYGTFGQNGVIAPAFSYYLTGNGRWLVNILDSFLLRFDRFLYAAVTPFALLLFAILLFRLICRLTKTDESQAFGIVVGLLALIDIQMTCETTYWITGAMNYLFPALLLVSGMNAALKLTKNDLTGKQTALNGLLCVLPCLTMEQFGLMALGWMLLLWGYECIRKKQIRKSQLSILLLSVAAFCTIFFAPGNFARVDAAAEKGNSVFVKLLDLLYYDYYSKTSSSFFFMLEAFAAIWFFQNKKILWSALSSINAVILLLMFVYGLADRFGSRVLLAMLLPSILLSMSTLIPCLVSVFRKYGIVELVALAVIGSGSQIMLLATDLWGFRTSFAWILVLIILLGALLRDIQLSNNLGVFAGVLCMPIHPLFGLAGLLLAGICLFVKKPLQTLSVCILLLAIIVALSDEAIGYQRNREIHLENALAAMSAAEDGIDSEIVLQPYKELQYGWTSPPLSVFHEKFFRSYYNIPTSDSIKYC